MPPRPAPPRPRNEEERALPSLHLVALSEPWHDDVLSTALHFFVHRDLMDAATHLMEGVGWTPITVQYAQRLRDLNDHHQLWSEESALIRGVPDDTWR